MLELYHWAPNGPWLKPLIVIAEKQIDCILRPIDVLAFEQYGDGVPPRSLETSLNQEGEGPLLVQNGRQLTESFFISEYIDSACADGPALRPTDPIAFNRMLAWARFANEVFMPGVNTLGCRKYLAPQLAGKKMPAGVLDKIELSFVRDAWQRAYANDYPNAMIEDSRRKIGLALDRIEKMLADGPYLLGQDYSLADIDAFAISRSLPLLAADLVEGRTRWTEWMARIEARPPVQKSLKIGNWEKPETAFAPGPEHARWG
ncbi:MAG TPA: glutathione S-transferase family protein [Croceibacterium sp.]|nr:glutathione S-transferase family protein [Croceibacterium sp.]